MHEDGFQFGAEEQIALVARNVEGLDPHSIAREHEPSGRLIPQRHREHAAQPIEAGGVPFEKRLKERFGIAMGMEPASAALQFDAQLQMIIDFTIECDDGSARSVRHWLIAALKVEDTNKNTDALEMALLNDDLQHDRRLHEVIESKLKQLEFEMDCRGLVQEIVLPV